MNSIPLPGRYPYTHARVNSNSYRVFLSFSIDEHLELKLVERYILQAACHETHQANLAFHFAFLVADILEVCRLLIQAENNPGEAAFTAWFQFDWDSFPPPFAMHPFRFPAPSRPGNFKKMFKREILIPEQPAPIPFKGKPAPGCRPAGRKGADRG